jgi:flagellar protein FliL
LFLVPGSSRPAYPKRDPGLEMAAKAKEPEKQAEPEPAAAEAAVEAPRPTGWRRLLTWKMIALVVAGVVFVGGGGTTAWLMLGQGRDSKAGVAIAKPAVFVDLPEVLVNLSNTGSDRTQYLKIKVVLELPDQLLMQQIQPVMPRLMDTFQTYLRELRPTDLDGSAGLYRLKEELTRRVNVAIAPNKVNAVLFKEIIVQ